MPTNSHHPFAFKSLQEIKRAILLSETCISLTPSKYFENLRPEQMGRYFEDDFWNVLLSMKISSKGPFD